MFEIKKRCDKLKREYQIIEGDEDRSPVKVVAFMLVYNMEDYLRYCINALKPQVDEIYAIDNNSRDNSTKILHDGGVKWFSSGTKGDLAKLANELLEKIPPNTWVFYVNPDEILFDLPPKFLGKYASFLAENKIYCSDVRFPDFVYNYGTLFANFDWGEGPGIYWTARRLFYYTGKERFVHPTHFNIANMFPNIGDTVPYNHEHTGEWDGVVAKSNDIQLFHYGKLRGVERQREKGNRICEGNLIASGQIATIPYCGPHPSVMKL